MLHISMFRCCCTGWPRPRCPRSTPTPRPSLWPPSSARPPAGASASAANRDGRDIFTVFILYLPPSIYSKIMLETNIKYTSFYIVKNQCTFDAWCCHLSSRFDTTHHWKWRAYFLAVRRSQCSLLSHKVDLVQDETTQCPLAALLPFQNHPQLQWWQKVTLKTFSSNIYLQI